MNRKDFLKLMATFSLAGQQGLQALGNMADTLPKSEQMPVLFIGHGSPMIGIEDNEFSRSIKNITKKIPKPAAILMVSAHWETKGTFVTADEHPKTIHDFGGFPKELFAVQYPAPGSKWLANETQKLVISTLVGMDEGWGLDHGCWTVVKHMYPAADVPIIQLSLDYRQGPQYHYDLAKQLASLRNKGVLIIGSGNMVHNFQYMTVKGQDFNAPFGHDWALEANTTFKKQILENDIKGLVSYKTFSKATSLAAPTPEHYLPLLYTMAQKDKNDNIEFFNDVAVAGSFTMTSVLIGGKS